MPEQRDGRQRWVEWELVRKHQFRDERIAWEGREHWCGTWKIQGNSRVDCKQEPTSRFTSRPREPTRQHVLHECHALILRRWLVVRWDDGGGSHIFEGQLHQIYPFGTFFNNLGIFDWLFPVPEQHWISLSRLLRGMSTTAVEGGCEDIAEVRESCGLSVGVLAANN